VLGRSHRREPARPSRHPRLGHFEGSRPNEIWISDVLVGPFVHNLE
jgi:hypothetical protein